MTDVSSLLTKWQTLAERLSDSRGANRDHHKSIAVFVIEPRIAMIRRAVADGDLATALECAYEIGGAEAVAGLWIAATDKTTEDSSRRAAARLAAAAKKQLSAARDSRVRTLHTEVQRNASRLLTRAEAAKKIHEKDPSLGTVSSITKKLSSLLKDGSSEES